MDLRQLQIFIAVAENHSFSKAAEQLYMAQSTISHQIRLLEKSLGALLFRRDSHTVELTLEGEEYLDYAIKILDLNTLAETRVRNISQGRQGNIRIAAVFSSAYEVSDSLARLYDRYPMLQVDVDVLEGSTMVDAIARRKYDFYFATNIMLPPNCPYIQAITRVEQYCLLVHQKYLQQIDLNDWKTLEKIPFVSVLLSHGVLPDRIRQLCRNRGFTPNIINYYNRAETTMLAVSAGMGATILPTTHGQVYRLTNVATLPIEGDDATITSIVALDSARASAATNKLIEILQELYGPLKSKN